MSKASEEAYDNAASTDWIQSSDWSHMEDILTGPPIAQVYEDIANLMPPQLGQDYTKSVGDFDALIVRFYKAQNVSSTIRRTRTVKETVYDRGPTNIMNEARSELRGIMENGFESKKNPTKSSRFQTTYGEDNLRFTYIHFPATNIDWMKDLLLRIMVDEHKSAASFHEVSSFLQSTWSEIPDRTSASRIMRPQFIERKLNISSGQKQDNDSTLKRSGEQKVKAINGKQDENTQKADDQEINDYGGNSHGANKQEIEKRAEQEGDKSITSSALYMPFLSFSTYYEEDNRHDAEHTGRRPFKANKQSRNLTNVYKDSVIHESATLDEAYYHFQLADREAQRDRLARNRNQVVTKQLKLNPQKPEEDPQPSNAHLPERKEAKCWPLVRVNQIWIWTIDNRWLISATTHLVDDVEQLWIDGFTDYLSNQVAAAGVQSQPGSTEDMMKAIVDYCVGSYEMRRVYRVRKHRDSDPAGSSDSGSNNEDSSWTTGPSIRQLFADYINSIGRKQTDLLHEHVKQREGLNPSERRDKITEATSTAEHIISEIRDVRDELNILKSIADYQYTVQKRLLGRDSTGSDLSASYVVNSITEMDRLATTIQSPVDLKLSLLQSEMANVQSEEAVRQGKVMMAFTIITIVFSPMSFLTSLFALDVGSFLEAPNWAFGVIFGTSSAFVAVALYCAYIFIRPNSDAKEGKQMPGERPQPTSQKADAMEHGKRRKGMLSFLNHRRGLPDEGNREDSV
ncbi:hypothetical protein F5Y13DRAFT_185336 [Hypoxylon sp. FL1857]|nr:hypothetical protein F5Y13DRAFT_185336 [Hypoxylon sp. FL1857]